MKEFTKLEIAIFLTFFVIMLAIVIWVWFYADCETLKAMNTQTPGRCIQ